MLKLFLRFNSLKYKIISISLILIISFTFLLIFLWYFKTSNEAEKSAELYISEMLKNSNKNFDVALKDINYIVSSAAVNRSVLNILAKERYSSSKDEFYDNKSISDYLVSLYGYKYYLEGLMISSIHGREYSIGSSLPYNSLKSQKWYTDIINSNSKKIVIPPHSNGDDMVISVARSISDNGKILGLIIADVKCSILKDIFNINLNDKGTIFIVNSKTGEFIFKPECDKLRIADGELDFRKISKKFTSASGSFYTNIRGENILVVYYYSAFTNWTSVGLISKNNLLEGFNKTLQTTLLTSIIFCFIAVCILYLVLSLLTNNLMKLNKAVKNINKDNLDISVDINSKDEIGQLYNQFGYMVNRIKGLIEDIKSKEAEKRKAEIGALQWQINPHFLYNTLNTIKFLAILQGVENIKNVSEYLSTLLHVNMEQKQFISISEEVEYIKSYLSIQEYKYSNKFTYDIFLDDGVEQCMTLKLLLQPIVENALIHGIAQLNYDGVILIRIYREGSLIKLRVQDNGAGMDEETMEKVLNKKQKSERIGINNVISRIKLNFGEDYGLSILSQKNLYTIVELSIPVINREEVNKYV